MFAERGWIMKRTALSPDRTALVDVHTGESWTYTILRRKIIQWASFFTRSGFKEGERIAILSPNHPELFAILFACEMKGLIYVPLNWRLSCIELVALLKDCTPAILLFHDQFRFLIDEMEFPHAVPLLSLDVEVDGKFQVDQTVSEKSWMMIYTGGTTGRPKGVVLSVEAVNWNALNTIVSWGLTEEDRTINYMPLFHTGGLNALSIPILMAGGMVIVGSRFDAEEALLATDRYGATISLFVPTMYQSMIQVAYFDQSSFPSMQVFLSGGAPCPQTVYHSFHEKGLKFQEGYGLTEAGPNNFYIRSSGACRKIGSVGKSMLFNSVKILNDELQPCQADEVGELFLKGPHLFSGYWQNEKETADAFVDGWLRTGDLAKYDPDGDYFIVGRKKDIIISGGENVYPQEVEQCLMQFEGIDEAAVVGVEDGKWGEVVVAFVTMKEGRSFDRDAIGSHCGKFLGSYKKPKKLIELQELPITHVGKIDKQKLQTMAGK